MKNLIRFFALSVFVLILASCSDDDPKSDPNITTFNATLNGASEVPANSSTATGTAKLTYNKTTKIFSLSVTHNLAAATGGHIHLGAAGTNGAVIFALSNLTSPISYTSVALTAAQELDLMANLYYVNLHTAAIASGEIRGQLVK